MTTYDIRPWDPEEHYRVCQIDDAISALIRLRCTSDEDVVSWEASFLRQLISSYAVRLHEAAPPYELRDVFIADFVAHLDEQLEWSKAAVKAASKIKEVE